MYYLGDGVQQDFTEAFKLFKVNKHLPLAMLPFEFIPKELILYLIFTESGNWRRDTGSPQHRKLLC